MCDQCMESYVKLNDFYYSIINENEKIAGCIDIVDSVRTNKYFLINLSLPCNFYL